MSARFLLPLLAALCCLSPSVRADDAPSSLDTRITDVTVYRDRADVRRVAAELPLHAGRNVVRVAGLPAVLDASSVRASGSGGADIHIVNIDVARAVTSFQPTMADLRELKQVAVRSRELRARQEALQAGRGFLDALMRAQTEGEASLVTLTATPRNVLSDALSFLIDEIVSNRLESSRVAEELLSLEERAAELRGEGNDAPRNEEPWNVDVELDASAATSCHLVLEYTVARAFWQPVYDVEVAEDLGAIRIVYEANVSQSTGEDWDGVRVKLSSAQPGIRAVVPSLSPWWLSIPEPAPHDDETLLRRGGRSSSIEAPMPPLSKRSSMSTSRVVRVVDTKEQAKIRAINTTGAAISTNGNYAASFDIDALQDLRSDGRSRRLRITEVDVEGEVRHECVPKRSERVYLVATVRNHSSYPLLAGATRISLGGNFLGTGAIDNIAPGEAFDLVLGADAAVTVDRRMVRRRNDSSGSRWESEVAWDLRVTNHRREPVRVTVRDQLPISPDEDVSVRLRDVTPRTTGEPDIGGVLEWKLAIPPDEARTATFRYEVKFPPNRRPHNL